MNAIKEIAFLKNGSVLVISVHIVMMGLIAQIAMMIALSQNVHGITRQVEHITLKWAE